MTAALTHDDLGWTPDREDLLRRMWDEGKSHSQIAADLGISGKHAGNTVAKKAFRLGLPRRGYEQREMRRRVRIRPCRPASTPSSQDHSGRVALTALDDGMCRFPFGDGPFFFCGAKIEDGRSYCAQHHRVVYKQKFARTPLEELLDEATLLGQHKRNKARMKVRAGIW